MSKSNKELQQDPTMADHLDYKAEIITGMVAMVGHQFPEIASPGHYLLLLLIYPNSNSKARYTL